jgi:hypothetical protein
MMIATNTMSRIETTDTCDHSAENCGTQNPFQTTPQAGPTAKPHCNLELKTSSPAADGQSRRRIREQERGRAIAVARTPAQRPYTLRFTMAITVPRATRAEICSPLLTRPASRSNFPEESNTKA